MDFLVASSPKIVVLPLLILILAVAHSGILDMDKVAIHFDFLRLSALLCLSIALCWASTAE